MESGPSDVLPVRPDWDRLVGRQHVSAGAHCGQPAARGAAQKKKPTAAQFNHRPVSPEIIGGRRRDNNTRCVFVQARGILEVTPVRQLVSLKWNLYGKHYFRWEHFATKSTSPHFNWSTFGKCVRKNTWFWKLPLCDIAEGATGPWWDLDMMVWLLCFCLCRPPAIRLLLLLYLLYIGTFTLCCAYRPLKDAPENYTKSDMDKTIRIQKALNVCEVKFLCDHFNVFFCE